MYMGVLFFFSFPCIRTNFQSSLLKNPPTRGLMQPPGMRTKSTPQSHRKKFDFNSGLYGGPENSKWFIKLENYFCLSITLKDPNAQLNLRLTGQQGSPNSLLFLVMVVDQFYIYLLIAVVWFGWCWQSQHQKTVSTRASYFNEWTLKF